MKLTFKRPFSKSRKRELRRCSKKKIIALKKSMRQQVQLWYKICVHRFLFLTAPTGRKVNHLERCAHHFHRKRGAFTDVGPPGLTFRRASTWATRRFLLCDTKGGGDDGTTSRSFVCLHSLFVIVVIIPPYHLKKQNKKIENALHLPNSSRVSCWNSSLLSDTQFCRNRCWSSPLNEQEAHCDIFSMFIYFVYPLPVCHFKRKLWCNQEFF